MENLILTKYEKIYQILRVKLGIDLSNQIIKKRISLDKENIKWHIERYKTISEKYFISQELNIHGFPIIYSYILDSKDYIFEKDRIMDYYNETGISVQSRILLLKVIDTKTTEFNDIPDINNLHPDVKEWREHDDSLYGKLSVKIMSSF